MAPAHAAYEVKRAVMPSWPCKVLLPLAALCTACFEGYPTEDVVTVSPYEMTQAQRIEALNLLGAAGKNKWRYAIDAGCVLSVSHRQKRAGWATTNHRLDEASIETRFDKVDDVHYVQLASEGAAEPVRALASADRLAAQQGSLLQRLLKRDCGGEPSSAD